MTRAQSVIERTLSFRAPHHPIDIVGLAIVLSQTNEKIAVVGIERAQGFCVAACEVDFLQGLYSGDGGVELVFVPAIDFDAALVRFGEDEGEDVGVAVVGGVLMTCGGIMLALAMESVLAHENLDPEASKASAVNQFHSHDDRVARTP